MNRGMYKINNISADFSRRFLKCVLYTRLKLRHRPFIPWIIGKLSYLHNLRIHDMNKNAKTWKIIWSDLVLASMCLSVSNLVSNQCLDIIPLAQGQL